MPPAKRRPLGGVRVEQMDGSVLLVAGGFFEDRDEQGCEIHWRWLLAHWHALADKLEGLEQRGVLR